MINCRKKLLFCFLFSFYALIAFAQKQEKSYDQQFLLISENDSYTFKIIDRYYTNGIALRFSQAINENSKKKKILNVEIGQNIYTAYDTRKNYYYRSLDRPYTGFLYAKGGFSYLYKNENVFRWNVIAGVTGEGAKGKEVQRIIHNLLGFKPAYGWETQLKSEPSLNIQASFTQHLIKPREKKSFDAFIVSNAIAGTSFTKISGGFLFRLGTIEPSYNSSWWDARISASGRVQQKNHELFFYFQPSVIAQVFNATVQEGLFTDQEGRFTSEIQPFLYQHKFGGMYARNKWTIQLGYTYRTKEAKTMIGKEVYGTIAIGYHF
jgi:hypothetical protein